MPDGDARRDRSPFPDAPIFEIKSSIGSHAGDDVEVRGKFIDPGPLDRSEVDLVGGPYRFVDAPDNAIGSVTERPLMYGAVGDEQRFDRQSKKGTWDRKPEALGRRHSQSGRAPSRSSTRFGGREQR